MAQINLLKQQKTIGRGSLSFLPGLFVKLLVLILAAVVAYYGWSIIKERQVKKETASLQKKVAENKAAAAQNPDRDELLTRQQQLLKLSTLLDNHVYWSQVMPELAKATLKTAHYNSLKVAGDNTLVLNVNVPNLSELDKFLQVFDLPEFSKNFSNIRVGAFHTSQNGDQTVINFEVKMAYNPALLKYNPSAADNYMPDTQKADFSSPRAN